MSVGVYKGGGGISGQDPPTFASKLEGWTPFFKILYTPLVNILFFFTSKTFRTHEFAMVVYWTQ